MTSKAGSNPKTYCESCRIEARREYQKKHKAKKYAEMKESRPAGTINCELCGAKMEYRPHLRYCSNNCKNKVELQKRKEMLLAEKASGAEGFKGTDPFQKPVWTEELKAIGVRYALSSRYTG